MFTINVSGLYTGVRCKTVFCYMFEIFHNPNVGKEEEMVLFIWYKLSWSLTKWKTAIFKLKKRYSQNSYIRLELKYWYYSYTFVQWIRIRSTDSTSGSKKEWVNILSYMKKSLWHGPYQLWVLIPVVGSDVLILHSAS